MNENIKGRFIRLMPVEGNVASLRAGEIWVRASAISRIEIVSATHYAVQAGADNYRCSNDPFTLIAVVNGEPV
jgi:hypothetical protein